MNKLLSMAFMSLVFTSCVYHAPKTNSYNLPEYQIDFHEADEMKFDELVDTFFCIPLETHSSNLLGRIAKIQVDSIISVLDEMNRTVHLYLMDGSLLTVIDKKGMGPGEYVQLSDFFTSPKDGYVEILDPMQKKIIRYDMCGRFIKEMHLPFPVGVSKFTKINGYYVFDQQTRRNEDEWKYSVVVLSEEGRIVNKLFPYTHYADILLSSRNSFYRVDNELFYTPIYCDTVFLLNEKVAIPQFVMNFSDKWVDHSFVYGAVKDPMNFINKLRDCDFITFLNVMETKSMIWLDFMYKGIKYCSLINRSNMQISTYSNSASDDCRDLFGEVLATWNDFFIIPESADRISQKFGLEVESEDNPYILFVKFK